MNLNEIMFDILCVWLSSFIIVLAIHVLIDIKKRNEDVTLQDFMMYVLYSIYPVANVLIILAKIYVNFDFSHVVLFKKAKSKK